MTTMFDVSAENLSEEEVETIIQSRGFQKLLLYQRLAEILAVLKADDILYEPIMRSITEDHPEIESVDATQTAFSLFEDEVQKYTQPVTATTDETSLPLPAAALQSDATVDTETDDIKPEEELHEYLEERLKSNDEIEMKAKEIASAIGLQSTHVGTILGRWRHAEDPPFSITASESTGSGNIWTIQPMNGDGSQ
jgi:hypothetical protein